MLGELVHEAVDCLLSDHGAGRVVGVGDENQTGVGCDRGGHRVEVVDEAWIGHFDVFRPEERGHEFIDHKGVLGGDEFGIAVEKGVAEKLDDFV